MIIELIDHVVLIATFIPPSSFFSITPSSINTSTLLLWYKMKAIFSQTHVFLAVAMEEVLLDK